MQIEQLQQSDASCRKRMSQKAMVSIQHRSASMTFCSVLESRCEVKQLRQLLRTFSTNQTQQGQQSFPFKMLPCLGTFGKIRNKTNPTTHCRRTGMSALAWTVWLMNLHTEGTFIFMGEHGQTGGRVPRVPGGGFRVINTWKKSRFSLHEASGYHKQAKKHGKVARDGTHGNSTT